ncbi:lonely Cys domain-containing protein, partial [Streptomyces sp. NPDC000941]
EAVAWVTWLMSRLPKDRWLDISCCWIGSPKDSNRPGPAARGYFAPEVFVADPLRVVSVGQRIVNGARCWARVSYGPQGFGKENGKYVRALFADPQGRTREWDLLRMEPEDAELEWLARVAELHSRPGAVPAEVLERTLYGLRALKSMFGVYAQDRADFGELLRGVAAVDSMWLADDDFKQAGPLMLDLLRQVIVAHAGPGVMVDQDVVRRVLAAAAKAGKAGVPFRDFVDLPVVRLAAGWLNGGGAQSEAVDALKLSGPDQQLGEVERSRMFWAWVKTVDLLSAPGMDMDKVDKLAVRVLHLDPNHDVEPHHRERLRVRLTQAFVVGRDASDPDVAAAYALEEEYGAFTGTGLDTVQDGARGSGLDFTGQPRSGVVNLAQILAPGGLKDAPWRHQGPNQQATEPAPYLVRIELDELDPDSILLIIGDSVLQMPVREFLELMANDLTLTDKEEDTLIVLSHAWPAPGIGEVARRLAQRLGREVGWTDTPTDLSGKDDQNRSVLTVLAASDAVWRKAEVEVPQPPVPNAPRPIPRPYPRSGPPGPAAPTAAPPTTATTTGPTALGSAAPSGLAAASSATPPGEKPEATTAPVAPLVLSPDPASFPDPASLLDDGVPSAPEESEESALSGAPPASPWDMARIRYAEEALDYEERLATYLAADERINAEFARVVEAFWALVLHNGMDYRKFGSELPSENGAVGTSFESLQRVVESGNLRERADFLFAGAANGLLPDLTGGRVRRHPVVMGERDDRRKTEAYTRYKQRTEELRALGIDDAVIAEEVEDLMTVLRTPLRPEDVRPPLSQDERLIAVRASDGKLLWMPAGLSEELPMSAGLQQRSQESGGLVLTGTSGSTHFILTLVARLSNLANFPVDLGLIRAGLVSTMAYVGDHSFHEVMAGAQLVLDEVAHPGVPDYVDDRYRYRNVYPLTEEELRAHVARDGLFPDEHALALFAELDDAAEEGSESDDGDDSSDR